MGILNIVQADRAGAHLLIQLFGGPRTGKTFTALRLARGIAGPTGRIGFLDTEAGRARLYADKIAGGFMVGELTPPFTPARYRQAITEFMEAGVDVLVIDSFSHVWEGVGGVLDMADANGGKGLQKWLGPKVEYRKLVQFLLSVRVHIIFCSRGKQPIDEKTMKPLAWEPIQDKRLKYEMTLVVPMELDGRYDRDPQRMKVPGDLAHLFDGNLLTEQTGAQIAAWVAGGLPIDHAAELLLGQARDAATGGMTAYGEFWSGLTKAQRAIILPRHDDLKSAAAAADDYRAAQAAAESERLAAEQQRASLDDPFGAAPPADQPEPHPADENGGYQPAAPDQESAPAPTGRDWKAERIKLEANFRPGMDAGLYAVQIASKGMMGFKRDALADGSDEALFQLSKLQGTLDLVKTDLAR